MVIKIPGKRKSIIWEAYALYSKNRQYLEITAAIRPGPEACDYNYAFGYALWFIILLQQEGYMKHNQKHILTVPWLVFHLTPQQLTTPRMLSLYFCNTHDKVNIFNYSCTWSASNRWLITTDFLLFISEKYQIFLLNMLAFSFCWK